MNPELTFTDGGKLSNSAPAIFHNMPQSALLTLIMDTPQSWMVEAVNSPYDLDNIHLAEVFISFIISNNNSYYKDSQSNGTLNERERERAVGKEQFYS